MLGKDGSGRVGGTDRRFRSRCPRTHSHLNVAIELASLTPNPVHERRRQHIQIVTGRPMIVHIPVTIPIIPPTLRSEAPPPLSVLEPPPRALLLLVGEVEGVEGAVAAVEVDVDAAFHSRKRTVRRHQRIRSPPL
jgi:hypothetical protein